MGAFRVADGSETLEALTHQGLLRLEVAPRHVALTVGSVQVAITSEYVTVTHRLRNRLQRRSEKLVGRLMVARDVPHDDVGIWLERDDGTVRRVFGVAPHDLIADDGLAALRALDRLTARLRQAIADHLHGARRAFEVGRGYDKVLVADHGDHLVVFARRLFGGDIARRVVEIHRGGQIVLPARRGDRKVRIAERYGITVTGDTIRFIDREGTDVGKVVLHWIGPQDRAELASRFGDMVEGRHVDEAGGRSGAFAAVAAARATHGQYQSRRLRPKRRTTSPKGGV
jgi:hypothetical protein